MTFATKTIDTLLEAGIFSKETAKSLALNAPQWLADKRKTAWSIFEETPMPTTKDEPWRRTDISKVKWNKFKFDHDTDVAPVKDLADLPQFYRELLDEDREAAGRMLIVNGQLKYLEVDPEIQAKGVIFTDLISATTQHSDLVEPHLAGKAVPPSDSKFAALNAALWQNGAFLYVPRNVALEKPFQTAIVLDGQGAASVHRSLIVAQESAEVDYIEETASANAADLGLSVGVVEIVAQANSQVRYVDVQQLGDKVYNFNTKRSLGEEDSNVIWDVGEFGGRLTKTFIDSQLVGDGAMMSCNGVYFLDGKQHLDLDTMMRHTGYSTGGDLLLHGALKDKSRSVFIGMIKIDPTGQLTNSYLKNQNMLLDRSARADSIPSLEIDANDVRASHAATVKNVEDEYVFYLQSRGIPYDQALKMIVEGFFSTVFNRMGNERVRTRLMDAVLKKMSA